MTVGLHGTEAPNPDDGARCRALIIAHVAAGDVGVDEALVLALLSRQAGRLLAR